MKVGINETHDPRLRSWVASANAIGGDFPIQNLPFAVFRRAGRGESFRGGVAIGDQIVDLQAIRTGAPGNDSADDALDACRAPTLNRFMSMGHQAASRLRATLSFALREGSSSAAHWQEHLIPQADAEFGLPADIGDYTDFYSSIHHAKTVGRQFRPDSPLLPNYQWIPIAYHGRSSSIRVSGHGFSRPKGQCRPTQTADPEVRPTQRLDFELEVGVFVGQGNDFGRAIPIEEAEAHIFGLCLLNDWSARDIQAWEYQPLGPFLSKNFASTISPWIITLEALAPFRVPFTRPPAEPQPLPYLSDRGNVARGGIGISLEVALQTNAMRTRGLAPEVLAVSNFRHAYWTIAQILAHHTVNGCNLRTGDLLGSGTLSGPAPSEAGSLLELTSGGTRPIGMSSGEDRTYLEDGDRVTLRAWCECDGWRRIGFGSATATVEPAT